MVCVDYQPIQLQIQVTLQLIMLYILRTVQHYIYMKMGAIKVGLVPVLPEMYLSGKELVELLGIIRTV